MVDGRTRDQTGVNPKNETLANLTLCSERKGRVAKWDHHTKEFKAGAVERMKGCGNVKALTAELEVSRTILYQWKYKLEGEPAKKRPTRTPSPDSPAYVELKQENVNLKIALADKTLEASFFRGALQRVGDRRRRSRNNGDPASTTTSQK